MTITTHGRDDIGIIKTLWEGLRDHHQARSTHFAPLFSQLTFEKRMAVLTGRDRFTCLWRKKRENRSATVRDGGSDQSERWTPLFVGPDHRRKGFGEALVLRALKMAS
jgi:GNAT superfamily N-acetyltransferase